MHVTMSVHSRFLEIIICPPENRLFFSIIQCCSDSTIALATFHVYYRVYANKMHDLISARKFAF